MGLVRPFGIADGNVAKELDAVGVRGCLRLLVTANVAVFVGQEFERAHHVRILDGWPGLNTYWPSGKAEVNARNACPVSWRSSRFEFITGGAERLSKGVARLAPARFATWAALRDRETGETFAAVATHLQQGIRKKGLIAAWGRITRLAMNWRQMRKVKALTRRLEQKYGFVVGGMDGNHHRKLAGKILGARVYYAAKPTKGKGFADLLWSRGPVKITGVHRVTDPSDHDGLVGTARGIGTKPKKPKKQKRKPKKPKRKPKPLAKKEKPMADYSVHRYGTDTSGRGIFMTAYMHDWWERVVDRLGFTPTIVQGAFMVRNGGGAKASAGYHDAGGCIDVRVWNLTAAQQKKLVRTCREMGAAAWVRDAQHGGMDPHCHITLGSDRPLSSGARASWNSYVSGHNGLASNGPDYEWRPSPLVTTPPPEEDDMANLRIDVPKNSFEYDKVGGDHTVSLDTALSKVWWMLNNVNERLAKLENAEKKASK